MVGETPDTKDQSRLRRRILLAVGLWIGMFLWANIPPYRGNVLEQKTGFFVWHWQLYTVAGHGVCDVRYYDMNQDGAPIERWTLLGYESPGDMPDKVARTEKKKLFEDYARVCRALRKQGDRNPNVEVSARCAERTTWKQVERRRRNVCTVAEQKAKQKPKQKKPKQKVEQ